jgi:hypothetical protein
LQNKPNFPDAQMNVSANMTKDYENKSNPTLGENKPNSNPIAQERKMNAKFFLTRYYENELAFRVHTAQIRIGIINRREALGPTVLLLKIEQRLGLDHCDLVRESGEGVDVQFAASGLKINVAEGLQIIDFQIRELDKHAAISGEPLKVDMALAIQVGAHLLDLKIGHVAYPPAQGAFVGPRAAELEPLNQTSVWKQLARSAYDLTQARILGKDANNVRAAGDPDKGLVLVGL